MKMNKNILQEKDLKILSYNHIEAENKIIDQKQSETFDKLEQQIVITIEKSGKYSFENLKNVSKYAVININNNLDVEIYELNQSEEALSLIDIEINIAKNSKVEYLLIDQVQKMYQKRIINVYQNAQLDFKVVGLNQLMSENQININLIEKNAQAKFKLATIAKKNAYNVYHSEMNNLFANTKGDIWQKGVVKNNGKNEFLATGFIKKGADDASNFQESRVLLLDNAAKGDASPLLLIDHYNVLAGHAASVSRVNENELYYLESRGIEKSNAEKLMTIAFVKPLIDEIKDKKWQDTVQQTIENLLTNEE